MDVIVPTMVPCGSCYHDSGYFNTIFSVMTVDATVATITVDFTADVIVTTEAMTTNVAIILTGENKLKYFNRNLHKNWNIVLYSIES